MDPGAGLLLYWWGVVQATFSIPDWKNVVYGWQVFLPATLAAYLLGAIPFGLLLTRLAGIEDIRKTGSGNIGATNVLRTGSKRLAAATLLLDATKGYAAVAVARAWLGPDVTFFAALAVVLSHMFPVWLGFRGGKGVATVLGVLLALSWAAGLATIATWLAVALLAPYSSLPLLVSPGLPPVFCWGAA